MLCVTKFIIAVLMGLLCLSSAEATQYQELSSSQRSYIRNYVVSNTIWALLHESGHMLIHEFKLPVLGKEEDAADTFATIALLQAEDSRAREAIRDVAANWMTWLPSRVTSNDVAYADAHDHPRERAYRALCLLIGETGSSPDDMKPFNYPENMRAHCRADVSLARDGWEGSLTAHIRETRYSNVTVSYDAQRAHEPEDYRLVRRWLMNSNVLELTGGMIGEFFDLPRKIEYEAKYCSGNMTGPDNESANAYYSSSGRITFCYELAIRFMHSSMNQVQENGPLNSYHPLATLGTMPSPLSRPPTPRFR